MQRPKWLSGWGKGKNPFEGSLIIDIPDIKVVEASFNERLVFFALGTSQEHGTVSSGESSKTNFRWRIFYDSTTLPDFIPVDKAKDLMAGTVAVSSGASSVYDPSTVYIASDNRPVKGNAPHLLDYEMTKKIEEARKKVR